MRFRRRQRLAAAGLDAAVEAEKRHHAVADELVDAAAGLLHRVAHLGEIPVEQEHHVIGQLALGELGEGAEIGEEDGDLALAAVRDSSAGGSRRAPGGRRAAAA